MTIIHKANRQYSLKSRIEGLLAEAEVKALAGESVERQITEVETLNKLAALKPASTGSAWRLVGFLGSVCILAVTAAAFWKTPSTRVQLDVEAMSVSLRPAIDVNWDAGWPVNASNIRFENIERASFPDFPEPTKVGHLQFDVTAENGSARLASIFLTQNANVSIDHSGRDVLLSVSERPSSVQLLVTGAVRIVGSDEIGKGWSFPATPFDDPPAEIVASGPGKGAVPASIRIKVDEPLRLGNLQVAGLAFSVERSDRQGVYKTSILSGSITLSDIGETVPLLPNETLRFSGIKGKVSLLELKPASLTVRFEGEVSKLSIGDGSFERDLTPSILDFLLHQKKVGLLWGALTGLWGLVWSASKLVK